MRLLHIITGLRSGGAERALWRLLEGGLDRGAECHVLSLSDEGIYGERIRALGVTVHTLDLARPFPTPAALFRLNRLVRRLRPDIIQGWMYHGNLAAAWMRRRAAPEARLAWNVRSCLYDLADVKFTTRQVIRLNRRMSGDPDALIYNSGLSRRQHEAFGFDSNAGHVIPNGFDAALFTPDPDRRRQTRERLAISPDSTVVGHVARFHPVKDHGTFMKAAARVAETDRNVVFLLAGRGVTNDNRALTGRLSDALLSRFRFLGERKDVEDLMQAMDVFCLSSRSEAFPNVVGEAMASGLPCVAADVGDTRELIGADGVLVPSGDADALARALSDMLLLPAEKRGEIGAAARNRIGDRFSIEAMVARYQQVYEALSG